MYIATILNFVNVVAITIIVAASVVVVAVVVVVVVAVTLSLNVKSNKKKISTATNLKIFISNPIFLFFLITSRVYLVTFFNRLTFNFFFMPSIFRSSNNSSLALFDIRYVICCATIISQY